MSISDTRTIMAIHSSLLVLEPFYCMLPSCCPLSLDVIGLEQNQLQRGVFSMRWMKKEEESEMQR